MINKANADLYFSEHVKSPVWMGFTDELREAAILSARRLLSRDLKRALDDNEPEYEEGDYFRDEYAIYEQAIYMLENNRVVSLNQESSPYPIAEAPHGPQQDSLPTKKPFIYAEEALRWLGVNGAAVVRG